MRVQQELLDRNDGSFLFRYRLRNSYDMIALTVQLKSGDYVADSPYMIDFVMEDSCYCPRPPAEWFNTYQCAASEPQVGSAHTSTSTYMPTHKHIHTHTHTRVRTHAHTHTPTQHIHPCTCGQIYWKMNAASETHTIWSLYFL